MIIQKTVSLKNVNFSQSLNSLFNMNCEVEKLKSWGKFC